jgi:GT2 family glycosyltransferase
MSENASGSPPLLWVVVPTRDRPGQCAEQVRRLLAEEPRERVRVCVIDDGSREPPELVRDARLRQVWRGASGGPNAARHDGVSLAPVDAVIVEADDDDPIEPGALRHVAEAFADPGVKVIYGDYWQANSAGERFTDTCGYVEKGEYRPGEFQRRGAIHVGLRAYRRELYDEVGGYRMDETPAGDLGLMLRFECLLKGRGIVHLARPLCTHVVDMTGVSRARGAEQARMASHLCYLARLGALLRTEGPKTDARAGFARLPEPEPADFSDVRVERARELDGLRSCDRTVAIVPTYRTGAQLASCLDRLAELDVPAVVVDDGCPKRSGEAAEVHDGCRCAVLRLSRNCGYPRAVNVGAEAALGLQPEFLLMLNADCYVSGEALEAMELHLDTFPDCAVAGCTHVRPDGRLDSKGSEWDWAKQRYAHVGRDLPDDTRLGDGRETVSEWRDVTTFACALVRASVWHELGGLDERYEVGYWEDADFCLRAREAGYDVAWVRSDRPAVHELGASGGLDRAAHGRNAVLFRNRWADTGLVDKHRRARGRRVHDGRVVCCMIACNEREWVRAALESVAPLVDEYMIAVGGTREAREVGMCDERGYPTDGTLEIVRESLQDCGKRALVHHPPDRPWRDKREMRQACAAHLEAGDWMLLVDGDEVFTEEGLWRLSRHMQFADVVCPGYWLAWNDLDTVGTGVWDGFPQQKAVRWREGMTYERDDNVPHVDGMPLPSVPGLRVLRCADERLYWHYSWVGPLEKLRRKAAWYAEKKATRGRVRPDYFDRVFMAWRADPGRVEAELGTHPFGGGGAAAREAPHPPGVRRMIERPEIGGDGW